MRIGRAGAAALLVCALASCAHAPHSGTGAKGVRGVDADSVTSALWRMDETVGLGVHDSGPFELDGTAGVDTRTDYGRLGHARVFTRSINSFVFVPYSPVLEAGHAFTVEAWIYVDQIGDYEDTPIAARWTPEPLQSSWILSVGGRNLANPIKPSPREHVNLVGTGAAQRLVFAFQPVEAGLPRAFTSARTIELQRWTHVAATYDGNVVRLYLNGRLDAQFASPGRVQESSTPLLIGNAFDPRWLTTFGGDLKAGPNADPTPYYAFMGRIDDVRISSSARAEFPYARE